MIGEKRIIINAINVAQEFVPQHDVVYAGGVPDWKASPSKSPFQSDEYGHAKMSDDGGDRSVLDALRYMHRLCWVRKTKDLKGQELAYFGPHEGWSRGQMQGEHFGQWSHDPGQTAFPHVNSTTITLPNGWRVSDNYFGQHSNLPKDKDDLPLAIPGKSDCVVFNIAHHPYSQQWKPHQPTGHLGPHAVHPHISSTSYLSTFNAPSQVAPGLVMPWKENFGPIYRQVIAVVANREFATGVQHYWPAWPPPKGEFDSIPAMIAVGFHQASYESKVASRLDEWRNNTKDYLKSILHRHAAAMDAKAGTLSNIFFDHAFEYQAPPKFNHKNRGKFLIPKDLTIDFKSVYNYFAPEYETGIVLAPESILPNLYTHLSDFSEEGIVVPADPYYDIKNIISITSEDNNAIAAMGDQLPRLTYVLSKWKEGCCKYFSEWIKTFKLRSDATVVDTEMIDFLQEKYSHIGISAQGISLLAGLNDGKALFPMYVDINIPVLHSELATTLKETKMSEVFLTAMMQFNRANRSSAVIGERDQWTNVDEQIMSLLASNTESKPYNEEAASVAVWHGKHHTRPPWYEVVETFDPITNKPLLNQSQKEFRSQDLSLTSVLGRYDAHPSDESAYFSKSFAFIKDKAGWAETELSANTMDDIFDPTGSNDDFFKAYLLTVFKAKVAELCKTKIRTYEEMLNGKLAYSEVVAFRIEKLKVGNIGEPSKLKNDWKPEAWEQSVQNIYLINASENDVLNYIDTQVKYGQVYRYKVYSYHLVIGTKYWYQGFYDPSPNAPEPQYLKDVDVYLEAGQTEWYPGDGAITGHMHPGVAFQMNYQASPEIIEQLYYETPMTIMDKPPVYPDVNIVPFKGEKNKLLFLLNGNTGRYEAFSVEIEPGDADANKIVAISQTLTEPQIDWAAAGAGGFWGALLLALGKMRLLEYQSDDPVSSFEIFRTDEHPKSYLDFKGKKIAEIGGFNSTAASYLDEEIVPNKKYYYTFRAKDVHGHVSIPTMVYRIEMINQNGVVYPIIDVVDFLKQEPAQPSKPTRKFISIKPALEHTIINEESTAESVSLGEKESIWGKKFKIRLISKTSGKKIDLNVMCNYNIDQEPLDSGANTVDACPQPQIEKSSKD